MDRAFYSQIFNQSLIPNGHRGELNITKVDSTTSILSGTAGWGIPGDPYIGNIFGFWDDNGWKITFLKEHQIKFESGRPIPNDGHGRDQLFTGYMWKGTTQPPPPYTHCLAGSFIAFGDIQGTGGMKYRSEFGWVATYPSSTSITARK